MSGSTSAPAVAAAATTGVRLRRLSSPKDVIRAEWRTPPALHNDEGMPDEEVVAQKSKKKKKDVFIDPEVVRKRREEKAAAKWKATQAEEEAKLRGDIPPPKLRFLKRDFVQIPTSQNSSSNGHTSRQTISIMTWNLLAQGLVRRTLFPGSDLLKWKDRGAILSQEFLHYSPTVACLQEVDRIEYHGPILRDAGYDFAYQKGYSAKLHGLCIAWKADVFKKAAEKFVKLDDATFEAKENTSSDDSARLPKRTACSRVTRNLGLFVALRFKQDRKTSQAAGIIFTTHHLFWHPRHQYERSRQVAVLLREIENFRRNENGGEFASWPCFFAGDFNIQPSEGTYRLMTRVPLSDTQKDTIQLSSVVHKSLDEHNLRLQEAEKLGQAEIEDDEIAEDEDDEKDDKNASSTGETYAQPEGDEDRVLKNTRPARDTDGLLSLDEMQSIYEKYSNNMWSVYGRYYGSIEDENGNWFGEREGPKTETIDEETRIQRVREGYYEPAWTSVTPLWRCTLDYIFYIPPAPSEVIEAPSFGVKRLLRMHRLADLEPGLPRFDKEPSDHVALIAEIEI